MLALDQSESMFETAFLTRVPANAQQLLDSIAALNPGKAEPACPRCRAARSPALEAMHVFKGNRAWIQAQDA